MCLKMRRIFFWRSKFYLSQIKWPSRGLKWSESKINMNSVQSTSHAGSMGKKDQMEVIERGLDENCSRNIFGLRRDYIQEEL